MSGNVVPATNIYLRTAPASASNSIFEVFGRPAGNNLVGLVGSNYNTSTRPPPFSATNTIPTAASGNLTMNFFASKSKFLASPTVSIGGITTTTLTPYLSGGSSYQIAVGCNIGTSNKVNWTAGSNNVSISNLSFDNGVSYYISGYSSNAAGSSSLAVSNANAFGIPNAPTGTVTFTITAANPSNNWTVTGWGAPSTGIQPTQYRYTLISNTTAVETNQPLTEPPYTGSHTFTANVTYSVRIYSYRPEASLNFITSSNGLPLAIPTGFGVSSVGRDQANLSWTAVAGANGYSIRYRAGAEAFSNSNVGNVTSHSFPISGNGSYDFTVFATYSASGYTPSTSSTPSTKRLYRYTTSQTNLTVQTNTYTVVVAGGGGGSASGYWINAGGGAGGTLQKSISLANDKYINFTPGDAGGASSGGYFSVFNYDGGSPILAPAGGGGGAGVRYYTSSNDVNGDAVSGGAAGGGGAAGAAGGGANASQYVEFYPDGGGGYYSNTITSSGSGGAAGNTNLDLSAGVVGSAYQNNFRTEWIVGGGGRGYLLNGSRGTGSGDAAQDTFGNYFRTVSAGGGGGGSNYASVTTDTVLSSLGAGGEGGILIMYT